MKEFTKINTKEYFHDRLDAINKEWATRVKERGITKVNYNQELSWFAQELESRRPKKLHYFRDSFGCLNHMANRADVNCSCREYWAEAEEVSDKTWIEDHSISECRKMGGECGR